MEGRGDIRYTPLSTEDRPYQQPRRRTNVASKVADDDNDAAYGTSYDPRFDFKLKDRVPWKSIALALFLASFGTLLLIISYLVFFGHVPGDSSQGWGFLVIGSLMFIPGFYETRLAYYAWRGSTGYSFSSIPDY